MSHKNLEDFKKTIWDYYHLHKRILPWRNVSNIYYILVSEIMLQQTQVSRVVPKYENFIKKFPTLRSLAQATLEEVLKEWSGLGYNRRGKYLHEIAKKIVQEKIDRENVTPEFLTSLPGIGKNTAGSVYVFTYNKPSLFIETNIRRVFIHEFFKDQEHIEDKDILYFLEKTLDLKNPREWYYALMDYGNYLSKIVSNPNRRSKHYTKQSPLKGSVREARGKILKILLKEDKAVTLKKLKIQTNGDDKRFTTALNQLLTENFLEIKHNKISIKK